MPSINCEISPIGLFPASSVRPTPTGKLPVSIQEHPEQHLTSGKVLSPSKRPWSSCFLQPRILPPTHLRPTPYKDSFPAFIACSIKALQAGIDGNRIFTGRPIEETSSLRRASRRRRHRLWRSKRRSKPVK